MIVLSGCPTYTLMLVGQHFKYDSTYTYRRTDLCIGPTKRATKITKRPWSSVLYPSCKTDKHCAKNNQFCAKECFTGACGEAKVPLGTKRSFCQPCKECQRGADAMAGNCNKCRARGEYRRIPSCWAGFKLFPCVLCVLCAAAARRLQMIILSSGTCW